MPQSELAASLYQTFAQGILEQIAEVLAREGRLDDAEAVDAEKQELRRICYK